MFVNNMDWSYNLQNLNSVTKQNIHTLNRIKDVYYKRILELSKSNEISVIKHNYDVNTFWNVLIDDDVIEQSDEYEQEYFEDVEEEDVGQEHVEGEDVEEEEYG